MADDKPVRKQYGRGGLYLLDNLNQLPLDLTAKEARLIMQTAIKWDKMGSAAKRPTKANSWVVFAKHKLEQLRRRRASRAKQVNKLMAAVKKPVKIRLSKFRHN